jgi:hypothetical protein
LENLYNGIDSAIRRYEEQIENCSKQVSNAEAELIKPFEHAEELEKLKARQLELNDALSVKEKAEEVLVSDDELKAGEDLEDEETLDTECDSSRRIREEEIER